jgi:hypothetical protein
MPAAKRFTCWNPYGFTTFIAESPREADKGTLFESILIIQGPRRGIRARIVECGKLRRGRTFREVKSSIKKGIICTIEIGDSLRVTNAVYKGRRKLGDTDDYFLAFSRDGVPFWAIEGDVVFVKVNGRRL